MKARQVEIVSVVARELSVPTHDPFVIATGRVDATRSVLVELELVDRDSGQLALGLGEGASLPPVTREDQPEVLDRVRRAELPGLRFALSEGFEEVEAQLDAALARSPVSRAGVEMALLDAASRLDGVPLYRWLGGSAGVAITTDITLPILAPERMAELAGEWWGRGFRSFKVKVGANLDLDLVALEAIHRAVPQAALRPDANGGYSRQAAIELIRRAEQWGLRIECFEQPCAARDLEGMAAVTREVAPPVIADESVRSLVELEAVIAAGAADGVNLKIAKSGGMLRARAIGVAAQRRGMPLMVGGMVETRLGMTAATHLAASLGGVRFPDLDTAWLLRSDPFVGGYREDGPSYTLPEAPGVGIRLRS